MRRPRCFFDISINGIASGRIVFELFTDVCPKTCENFRCLCTGEMGEGATTMKPLHYKNSPIHRIVRGFIVQGGDFSEGTGTGGESIYGGTFDDENFDLKHEHKFLLSMANKGPNTNGSQFFITTRPAPHLDGVHVVFGKVVSGQEFVLEIENQKVDGNHRPYADIRVSSCGELVAVIKKKKAKAELSKSESVTESEASSSQTGSSTEESESESGSESDGKASKRKRKKKVKVRKTSKKRQHGSKKVARSKKKKERAKHKKRKKQPQTPSESDSGPDEETMEPQFDPGVEVPPDIAEASKTSWLYRSSKSPPGRGKSPPAAKRSLHREREAESSEGRKRSPSPLQPRIRVSSSGRQIRGRGTVRYRTPPPSDSYLAEERSRSLHLPPHHFRDSRRKGWDDRSARDLHMRERGERGETGRRQRWRSRSPRRREVELRQRHFVSNSRLRSRSPREYVRPLQRQRRRSDFRSRSGSRSRSQSPRARRSPLNHRQQRKSRSRSRNGNRFRSRSPGVRRRPIQRQQGRSRFRSHSRSGSRSRSRSKTPVDHTRHTIQRRQRRFQSSHSRSRSQSPGHTRPTVQRQHKRSRFDSRSGSTTSESSTGDRSPARLVQSRTRRSSSGSR